MENFITTQQAAIIIGVGTRQIRYLCVRGELEYRKVGSSFVIDKESVELFRRKKPGPRPGGRVTAALKKKKKIGKPGL